MRRNIRWACTTGSRVGGSGRGRGSGSLSPAKATTSMLQAQMMVWKVGWGGRECVCLFNLFNIMVKKYSFDIFWFTQYVGRFLSAEPQTCGPGACVSKSLTAERSHNKVVRSISTRFDIFVMDQRHVRFSRCDSLLFKLFTYYCYPFQW